MTPRRCWVAAIGTLVSVNGTLWLASRHRGRGEQWTLCASTLRPALDAIPGSRAWLLPLAGVIGWRHLR